MRYLALLATYALVAALVLPGSLFAQDEAATGTATTPAEPAGPEPAQAAPAPAPAAPAPAQPAPAPGDGDRLQPVPESGGEGAPAPEPQSLGDEAAAAPASKPKALAAASGSVTIADFSFAPKTITVNVGDTVTWNNNGPTPHSAKANDGSFDTGILKKGQSASHTFNQAGTFSYFCQPHPFMKATVVVNAAQSSGGTSDSGSSDSGGSSGTSGDTSAEASQADDGGPALPDTGLDSGALLVLGGLILLLGIAMHRRTARHG
jgi:plastocyanin